MSVATGLIAAETPLLSNSGRCCEADCKKLATYKWPNYSSRPYQLCDDHLEIAKNRLAVALGLASV